MNAFAKRTFDIFATMAGLVLLAPLLAATALAVWLSMGSPVLFRQVRAGLHGAEFELFKFRTMREAYDHDGAPLPDEERVTRVGRALRRTRLDELPELLLVLSGAMSLVGPRPLPKATLVAHGVLDRRSKVRPGLTGLAQVSGNTLLSNEEKFAIDNYYGASHSLGGDLIILLATVRTIALGERRDEDMIERAMAACA